MGMMLPAKHSIRFLLLNFEEVPMTTHHLRILSKPGRSTPGKAIYANTQQPLDISFRYTEVGEISAWIAGSDETFKFIPLMDKGMLVGIKQVYPDGTTATFVKEVSEYNFEIQDAVFEKRLERVQI